MQSKDRYEIPKVITINREGASIIRRRGLSSLRRSRRGLSDLRPIRSSSLRANRRLGSAAVAEGAWSENGRYVEARPAVPGDTVNPGYRLPGYRLASQLALTNQGRAPFLQGIDRRRGRSILQVSPQTVMRDRRLARAWLARELSPSSK